MWCVWTAKGGAGVSVISAALAILSSRSRPTLLVDLGQDQLSLLGVAPSSLPADDPGVALGVHDWLAAPAPPPEALARLEISVGRDLAVLPTGQVLGAGHPDGPGGRGDGRRAERLDVLARLLCTEQRAVVVDVGTAVHRYEPILARSSGSVFVTRACYLALRRRIPARHLDRVVLVSERGRSLRAADLDAVLPAPVGTTLPWDPAVARAVDAGTLRRRLPRSLRALQPLLEQLRTASGGASPSPAVATDR